MEIIIIAGMDKNRIIGKGNELPWNIPEDLQNFKKLTAGNTIIMGRKTFQSIGRPLPKRNNIIITRSTEPVEGVDVCNSIEAALEKGKTYGKDIFIIGGATIYAQALPFTEKMILSHIHGTYQGDIYFPEFNKEDWEIINEEHFPQFDVLTYTKK